MDEESHTIFVVAKGRVPMNTGQDEFRESCETAFPIYRDAMRISYAGATFRGSPEMRKKLNEVRRILGGAESKRHPGQYILQLGAWCAFENWARGKIVLDAINAQLEFKQTFLKAFG